MTASLSQSLCTSELRSCVVAVARVSVSLLALGDQPCSSGTGAYCKARFKLSEPVIHRLAVEVADGCERRVDPKWLWHGRHGLLSPDGRE